jgi:hypothetical protein
LQDHRRVRQARLLPVLLDSICLFEAHLRRTFSFNRRYFEEPS